MVTQQAAGGGKRVKKALPPAAASMAGVPSGDASEVEKAPPSPSDSAADSSPRADGSAATVLTVGPTANASALAAAAE